MYFAGVLASGFGIHHAGSERVFAVKGKKGGRESDLVEVGLVCTLLTFVIPTQFLAPLHLLAPPSSGEDTLLVTGRALASLG